ncbi:MAG: translation elongation factor Ts [Ferrovum sp. 37-45-19]|uniref:translation elongation factor Ts n=1 Tax=Ferrovum sp. JA12 TaxID=1356299 RepID=UPI00070350F9|nr:translation elongation factor Ts [Ferrovum sp. JA12]OYV80685.1 MAG: translation elongation factor Ts [Ferrovum sp. 21-44-67]OYV95236.1 MAG: translation elongation factor Ts [Ferrovum sp. 37-45-19]OZB33743.1 MAG: translation elongation factor Ts [Ferrovum sp. 34-44-207]HQT80739.1 translation elongation factor Ts [Ferrovaceae bacterium]KRH79832.1 elongation factor Ts [Ferrovum sp. JA12]
MAEITASLVKELRELTGLGMMECKKALTEADGDIKAAEDLLRIRSGAKASKAAGRVTAEGVVATYLNSQGNLGVMVEVNCETDFVGKNDDFVSFAKAAAECVAHADVIDVEQLSQCKTSSGEILEEARKALVMKLGENITIRRFVRFNATGRLAQYLHGSKIGVMIDVEGGDDALGKDLAMHIAASKPICVSKEQVPAEVLDKEREIYTAQAAESGKPAEIVAKMVDGRIAKYLAEVTLLGQPFVKDPDQTVEKLLTVKKAKVHAFTMYVVGEGIEKKSEDFAAEVAAAAGAAIA